MTLILFALSVLPSLALLTLIRKQNTYSYHPKSLIIKLLAIGALSTFSAYFFEIVFDQALILIISDYNFYLILSAFVEAGLIEEVVKFCSLHFIMQKNDKYFKTFYDGIIYSVSVAMGFAILEDIIYAFVYYNGDIVTALLRAVTPGHLCFSIFMGIYYSEAKKFENKDLKNYSKNIVLSIVVPAIVHGFYDYCLFNDSPLFTCFFIILLISLYVFTYKTIKKKSEEIFFI